MSQTDTYRSDTLPEAVMTPAAEAPETPLPAAQEPIQPQANDPAAVPARRSNASIALEQLRNQTRRISTQNVTWMSAQTQPLGGGSSPSGGTSAQRMLQPAQTPLTRPTTVSRGAALTTLMRSAARQYSPAPALAAPSAPAVARIAAPPASPPMRGALRSVVRQAQGGQARPRATSRV